MRFIRVLLFIEIIFAYSICWAETTIDVVHPGQDSTIVLNDSTYIFGSVSPANASFWINEYRTRLYPNGAFIKMLPVTPGRFSFESQAVTDVDTVRIVRDIWIPEKPQTSPA